MIRWIVSLAGRSTFKRVFQFHLMKSIIYHIPAADRLPVVKHLHAVQRLESFEVDALVAVVDVAATLLDSAKTDEIVVLIRENVTT